MIPGIDAGSPQGNIPASDWKRIRLAGKVWAILRCGEGLNPVDGTFAGNLAGTLAADMPIGAYFVFHPWLDAAAQVAAWFAQSGGLGRHGDGFPPVIDIELDHDGARLMKPAELRAALVACIQEMTRLWGRPPMIYTYPFFLHAMLVGATAAELAIFAACPLWYAGYHLAGPPAPPAPWTLVTFWQSAGGDADKTPAGAPCDSDYYLGDEAGLMALASFVASVGPNPLAGAPVAGLEVPGENA